jgi:hypothetical protein
MTRDTNCIDCHCSLENVHNAKKRCDKCTEKFRAQDQVRRDRKRYLRKIAGAFTEIDNRPCLVCKRPTIQKKNNRNKDKRRFCGRECEAVFYGIDEKERYRWIQDPFTFRLSCGASARRLGSKYEIETSSCCFCGSVKALGEVAKRKLLKGGRVFCDEQCASEWKSIHYASANHKPMELKRQETRAKQQQRQEQAELKRREKEAAKALKPANQKTPGYVTCVECGNTVWVDQHAQKKYCSVACSVKSNRKTGKTKARRRQAKRNRDHIKRTKGIGDMIDIVEVMKRHKKRCCNCNTLCVKPEGYNWPNEANIDHILPVSKGGLHIWSNVQLLCRRCNIAKSDNVADGTQLMLDLRFK